MGKRWCKQCQQHGHRKWLWLGTHRTHHMYIKHKLRKSRRLAERDRRQRDGA